MTIRDARPGDLPDLLRLVTELAVYEKEPDAVKGTVDSYAACLFPRECPANTFALVAEVDGRVVGMAIWFLTFSTWTGGNGIHLEDLYVERDHRGSGLGKALLQRLAQVCVDRGYQRLEWWVLKWNTPSIDFYDSLDATPMDEWVDYRLDGPALQRLASPT